MEIVTGRALLDPQVLLKRAGLHEEMTYADLGAGTLGHFVFPGSHIVTDEGHVYAVDILPSALEAIESRARIENAHNVTTVWGDLEKENGVHIDHGSIDLISCIGLSRLIVSSTELIQHMRNILKPSGRLLILGWDPSSGSMVVPSEERISADVVQELLEHAGFALLEAFKAGPQHWGLILENRS